MSDFWKTLAGNSSSQLLMGSIDSLLSGRAVGEDFERVRTLTDVHREANALPLPVEAGTKVSFTGGLGAYMTYENPPPQGSTGEVVNVKSANGDVTHHEGKVFVQWDDGEFRPIHAEHLRLASTGKTADLKAQFEKIKDLAKKKPDNKFLDSVLEQLSKGHTLTEKQLKVIKTIEGEVKEMASMQKQLKTLEKKQKAAFRVASLGDLTDFLKVSEETLVHKSTNDLWSVAADGEGFTITRLFDDEGEPLKG